MLCPRLVVSVEKTYSKSQSTSVRASRTGWVRQVQQARECVGARRFKLCTAPEKKIQTNQSEVVVNGTRGWFTCGTFEDGNVVEVGAVGGEFDVQKTRPVMRVVGNSNAK
jgi:hypothetical protein